jgi:hypothetical protein
MFSHDTGSVVAAALLFLRKMIGDRIEDTRSVDETIDWIDTICFQLRLRED